MSSKKSDETDKAGDLRPGSGVGKAPQSYLGRTAKYVINHYLPPLKVDAPQSSAPHPPTPPPTDVAAAAAHDRAAIRRPPTLNMAALELSAPYGNAAHQQAALMDDHIARTFNDGAGGAGDGNSMNPANYVFHDGAEQLGRNVEYDERHDDRANRGGSRKRTKKYTNKRKRKRQTRRKNLRKRK